MEITYDSTHGDENHNYVPKRMDPEIKARWVAALRSGEYRQGRGALCTPSVDGDLYCCLGILASLHPDIVRKKDGDIFSLNLPGESVSRTNGGLHLPSVGVDAWAGTDGNYAVKHEGVWTTLYSMNDRGVPFDVIADVIEEQL